MSAPSSLIEQELNALRVEHAKLRQELDQLTGEHQALLDDHRIIRFEHDLLQERLKAFLHKLYAAKSEARKDSGQQELFNEAEHLAPAKLEVPDEPECITVPAHPRAKPGRKPLDPALPRQVVRHELPEAQRTCPKDGSTLKEIGVEASEQLDIVPAQIRVIRHERVKYACPCCDQSIKLAPAPKKLINSLFTPAAQAWIATAKYQDGLPLYRQAALFKRVGGELSRSTLATTCVRLGRAVQPLVNLLQDHFRQAELISGDETEVQVLKEPGRKPQSKSYMWVRMTHTGPPIRLFDYAPSKSAATALELYRDARGTLISDGYEAYDTVTRTLGLKHLGCLAHARRYFIEAENAIPKPARTPEHPASRMIGLIAKLYALEKEWKGLGDGERTNLRQAQSRPILDQMQLLWQTELPHTVPTSLLGKALGYMARQWDKLIGFVEDGRYRLDNNLTENAIRPFVIARKNFLFCDSVAGAKSSANLYSLIETAKANGIEPCAYLAAIFERMAYAQSVDDYEALLPWNIRLGDQIESQ